MNGVVKAGGMICLQGTLCALLIASTTVADETVWSQVYPPGELPTARDDHAMAYDSARGVVVLFGGHNESSIFGDTWEWNGTEWIDVTPSEPTCSPSPRAYHAMAYDSGRGVVVLFGGNDGSSNLGDTWEWNGTCWTQPPANGPSPRREHAMAYDSARGVVVLFGGLNDLVFYGDTWEWDGASWSLEHPGDPSGVTAPSARGYSAMAYDSARSIVVLYGGWDWTSYYGDTWAWNGSTWTDMTPVDPADRPSARGDPGMAEDSARDVLVLFGGNAGESYYGDTWEWDGTNWTEVPASGPSPRTDHAMAYDSARCEVVLFGGSHNLQWFNDTWLYFEDCNANGQSDCRDVGQEGTSCDRNGNNVPDECEWCIADLNCDGFVNVTDFAIFAQAYGQACPQ